MPRNRCDGLHISSRLRICQDISKELLPFLVRNAIEELPLLARHLPFAEFLLLRYVERLDRILDELGPAHAELVGVVVALHELDEEPFVVEELPREGLQQRPERIFVLVDGRQELRSLRFEVRLQLLDVGRSEGEVLHVGLRVFLRFPGEAIRKRSLSVRDLVGCAHPEDDREPLTGQRTQACESCHGRLLLADALGLVDRRVSAVEQEVSQRAVRVDVAAQDGLVVHLEFQERGRGGHSLTGCESKCGTITLSWHRVTRNLADGVRGVSPDRGPRLN